MKCIQALGQDKFILKSALCLAMRLDKVKSHNDEPFINLQQLYEFEFPPVTGYDLNKRGLYDQSY